MKREDWFTLWAMAVGLGVLIVFFVANSYRHERDSYRAAGLSCLANAEKSLALFNDALDTANKAIDREKTCLTTLGHSVARELRLKCEADALSQSANYETARRIVKACAP